MALLISQVVFATPGKKIMLPKKTARPGKSPLKEDKGAKHQEKGENNSLMKKIPKLCKGKGQVSLSEAAIGETRKRAEQL